MRCQTCGREAENGQQTHWLNCPEIPAPVDRERTRESECIKDGCTKPRAASKGPRPTKYCDDHKTGSKK